MDYPGGKTEFAVAPDLTVYPIRSATSPPFQHTNLVVLLRRAERAAVIVDPGGNDAAALAAALQTVPSGWAVFVVITHKHHDHWASLEQVRAAHPEGTLCGSKECLSKVGGAEQWKRTIFFPMDRDSVVAGLRVVPTPGHTDGDVSVLDTETGVACVGDHCVGFGSSLLDADCGETENEWLAVLCVQLTAPLSGDMTNYLDTCRKLIDLAPKVIVPAHGPISHEPVALLKTYIAHRLDRERQVRECVERGLVTPQQIVEVVYASTPRSLWPAAMSNIALHLRRIKTAPSSL